MKNEVLSKYFYPVLSLIYFPASAQNLVLNPGFDEFKDTVSSISSLEYCTSWINPTMTSPDYFNSLLEHNSNMSHPREWWGYQTPQSGTACAGFIAYRSSDIKKSSEYLEARFTEPLVAGEMYQVAFSLSLAECSSFSLTELDAYLSNREVFMKTVFMLKYKPQLVFVTPACDTASWTKLSLTYKAKGGEQYMVIGLFDYDQRIKLNKETPSASIHDPRNEAYYFIDDVSVIPLKQGLHFLQERDSVPITVAFTGKTEMVFDTQKPFVLEHILFETGSDVLMPASYPELDDLVLWLSQHPQLKAEVNGYTDADGTETQNLKLSQKRAQAVCRYLSTKGIANDRLKPQGFGASNPRDSNITEVGKARNRRVEIKTF